MKERHILFCETPAITLAEHLELLCKMLEAVADEIDRAALTDAA